MAVMVRGGKKCAVCKVVHEVEFPGTAEELQKCVDNYNDGAFIQDAFHMLDVNQREILVTGLCQTAWDQLFKE